MLTVSDTGINSKLVLRSSAAIREEKIRHFNESYYMIHPFSNARERWDEVMMCVFFGLFILIPIKAAMSGIAWSIHVPKASLDIICCCDIFISFASGYHNVITNKIILDRYKVAIYYLKTYFFIDFISSVAPTFMVFFCDYSDTCKIFVYASYLKILRIGSFLHSLDRLRDVSGLLRQFSVYNFKIFKMVVICLIGFLWTTSFYHIYRVNKTNTKPLNFFKSLLYSCLGSLYNLLLIGYGLEKINDTDHMFYVSICLMIGVVLEVFIYAQALHMLHTNLSVSNKYQNLMKQLQEFIRYKQLPDCMRKRILQFFDFKFEKSYFKESEILDTLSDNLKQDIVLCICQNLIEKVEFFHELPASLLMRMVKCMKSEIFLQGDVIVKAGGAGECMYFISSGTTAVYTDNGKEATNVCHLSDGCHFGEVSLIMDNEKRIATVVAIECCDLYTLSRKDFQKAVEPYPELKHNMKKLAEKRLQKTMVVATSVK
ncbi:hypothetical protein RN001_013893 [Aquatica leii]|uniref:Cyclic nucleotide-binding domain-containing protein n=1 Tax=Aquatica leii TaxID=1421715 RepID=A0AAN7QDI9_9COLE|nr:hypothetical protein RN001_013893 [Aquatica leii]